MSMILNSSVKRIYGEDYKIKFIVEDKDSTQCCYEIYDSNNEYIGSAGTKDEIYEVVRERKY